MKPFSPLAVLRHAGIGTLLLVTAMTVSKGLSAYTIPSDLRDGWNPHSDNLHVVNLYGDLLKVALSQEGLKIDDFKDLYNKETYVLTNKVTECQQAFREAKKIATESLRALPAGHPAQKAIVEQVYEIEKGGMENACPSDRAVSERTIKATQGLLEQEDDLADRIAAYTIGALNGKTTLEDIASCQKLLTFYNGNLEILKRMGIPSPREALLCPTLRDALRAALNANTPQN